MEYLSQLYRYLLGLWEGYGLPAENTSLLLSYGIVLVLGIPSLGLWLRWRWHRSPHLWVPVLVTLLVPLALAGNAHLTRSFKGTPDVQCQKYENGTLRFVLVGKPLVIPASTDEMYGAEDIVFTVRAPDRWGDEVHLCVFSANDPKARELFRQLIKLMLDGGDQNMEGEIGFTFGFGRESPNVTWLPDRYPEEKGAPEQASGI